MSDPTSASLRDVSDTALWVAAYRAEESERSDALFRDPWARLLAGERGFELLDAMPAGRTWGWPMVTRTVLFDRIVRERLVDGLDLVVNLAAGLDARPYRMELPAGLCWVEVDLPAMIEYKTQRLVDVEPVCRLERVALDLADGEARRDLLASLGERGRRMLVLTEGLLIYLEEGQVEDLAQELAALPAEVSWVTDLASWGVLRLMDRNWGREVEKAGAPFRFAPSGGPEWFRPFGWTVAGRHSLFHEAAPLRRLPPWMRPFALLPEPPWWLARSMWSGVCELRNGETRLRD